MKISKYGIDLIKEFERFSSNPYTDSVGVITIGYGSTYYLDGRRVLMSDKPIAEQEATELIKATLERDFEPFIPSNVNQNQFDALCSLIYNIGASAFIKSTIFRKVAKNPNDKTVGQEFLKWNKGRVNGSLVELKGLTIRRKKEAELYFK
jgi:lysozyme